MNTATLFREMKRSALCAYRQAREHWPDGRFSQPHARSCTTLALSRSPDDGSSNAGRQYACSLTLPEISVDDVDVEGGLAVRVRAPLGSTGLRQRGSPGQL